MGRKTFHATYISWSYRKRGKVPRAHTKKNLIAIKPTNISEKPADRYNMEHSDLMKRIDMYSARNTITNSTDLYSVLKPDTNSLSPSAKSNGDRFASANTITENSRKATKFQLTLAICLLLVIS